jgi:hypothetical protein
MAESPRPGANFEEPSPSTWPTRTYSSFRPTGNPAMVLAMPAPANTLEELPAAFDEDLPEAGAWAES